LLKPSFNKSVSEDELDLGHMINNGAFGSLFFRGINSMGVAGGNVCTAVGGDEGEGDRIFRKEVVYKGAFMVKFELRVVTLEEGLG
jgi:hypothetical protein